MIRPLRSRTKSSRRSQTSSETTLKGLITSWRSQPLSSAPPTISWCLRNSGTQRDGLWVRQESIGPVALARGRGRSVTTTAGVLGHNLWSGLWYATVSGGGIRTASSRPDNQETSGMEQRRPLVEVLRGQKCLFSPLFTQTVTELQQEAIK